MQVKLSSVNRLTKVAMWLWVLHGASLVALAVTPEVNEAVKAVDIAREKDVVWLSLATAIVAIGFSAWLVRQLVNQQAQVVKALQDLRAELGTRPCILPEYSHSQPDRVRR